MNDSRHETRDAQAVPRVRHAGPPLWLLATLHTVLFLRGLYPVTVFGGQPHYPGPWESPGVTLPSSLERSVATARVPVAGVR